METLLFYTQKAETTAKSDTAVYETDTLTFLQKLFKWKYPHVSTYQGEKACIVLIRPAREGEEPDPHPIKQIWVSTYKAHQEAGEWVYKDNFTYIAKLIKALSDTQQEGSYNIFMSYNTFIFNPQKRKYTRTQTRAFRSQVIGVDLDFYHMEAYQGLSYEEAITKIKNDHKAIFKRYEPMVIKSGGGCQLYFLNCNPIRFFDIQGEYPEQIQEEVHKFKELSKFFNNEFLDAGADTKCKGDTARIFRPPGVYSIKYETPVKIALTAPGQRHSFRGIDIPPMPQKPEKRPQRPQESPQGEAEVKRPLQIKEPPQEPQKPAKSKKVYKGINGIANTPDNDLFYYTKPYEDMVQRRLDDLDTILNMKNDLTGFRELYLFIYCILLKGHKDIDEIQYTLYCKNQLFKEPLPQPEIDNIIRQVMSKPYKVSNQYIYKTLVQPLGIDPASLKGYYTEEQVKAANREYRNKHYSKKSKKTYSKQEKIDFITTHPDMSSQEIATALCCSKRVIEILRKAA